MRKLDLDKIDSNENNKETQREAVRENLDNLGYIMDNSFMIDEDNEEDLSDIIN